MTLLRSVVEYDYGQRQSVVGEKKTMENGEVKEKEKEDQEQPELSGAELDVLKVLWEQGPSTVRQVKDALGKRGRTWAYTTVMTLLGRLLTKGYARSDSDATAHIYHPTTTREELMSMRVQSVADQLCGGSTASLVLNLIQGRNFPPEEIGRLRKLIGEWDPSST